MICTKCKIDKNIDNFILKKNGRYDSWCNSCHGKMTNKFKKTILGLVGEIYNAQKHNSKQRGHIMPEYTKKELEEYLLSNEEYIYLYKTWVNNNFIQDLRPSIDRLDDNKHYSFDNIRIVTFKENRNKQKFDIMNGIGPSGKRCKKVAQIKDGNIINIFVSASDASRSINGSQGHISACCRNERKSHKGFQWKYQ